MAVPMVGIFWQKNNNNNILPSPSLNIALDAIILMRERYQFEYITFYSSIDSK